MGGTTIRVFIRRLDVPLDHYSALHLVDYQNVIAFFTKSNLIFNQTLKTVLHFPIAKPINQRNKTK